jgi:hypothetical protein
MNKDQLSFSVRNRDLCVSDKMSNELFDLFIDSIWIPLMIQTKNHLSLQVKNAINNE